MTEEVIDLTGEYDLYEQAYKIRQRVLKLANGCGKNAHLGGALSMVDILTVLYKRIMKYDFNSPTSKNNDKFILSKGHCVVALYAVLNSCSVISDDLLLTFQQNGSALSSHPVLNQDIGIESSSGSLGQGISLAVGIAKANKLLSKSNHVYTLIGNGESNEGSVWEAAAIAGQWGLDNLTVILDNNRFQSDGESSSILDGGSGLHRWESFGFNAIQIDGHNIVEIIKAFEEPHNGRPKIIIADTVKGKGIPFMEGNNNWHHSRLTDSLYEEAITAMEKNYDRFRKKEHS